MPAATSRGPARDLRLLGATWLLLAAAGAALALSGGASAFDPIPAWSAAEQIDGGGGTVGPWVESEGNGTFWAAWNAYDTGSYYRPFTSKLGPAAGWSSPDLVSDTAPNGTAGQYSFFLRPGGRATMLWIELGTPQTLWYADYTAPSGWAPAIQLGGFGASVPSFITHRAEGGEFAIAWYEGSPIRSVWASVYGPAGFTSPTLVETNDNATTTSRAILALPGGGATVTWQQRALDNFTYAWYNDYSPISGWSGPRRLDRNDTENVTSGPIRGLSNDGSQLLYWRQNSNGTAIYRYATRAPGGAWSAATDFPAALAVLGPMRGAYFAPAGFALGWWEYLNSSDNLYYVMASRFDWVGGWSPPQQVSRSGIALLDTIYSSIVFDSASNGYLAWSEKSAANFTLWIARYSPASGWSPAALVAGSPGADALYPLVLPYAPDLAILYWVEYEAGSTSIRTRWHLGSLGWSNETVLYTGAPSDFQDYSHSMAGDAQGNAVLLYAARAGGDFGVFARRGSLLLEPISVAITSPTEGAHTSLTVVAVSGTLTGLASGAVEVKVDGGPVPVRPDGAFSTNLTLGAGAHRIEVSAADPFGRTAFASVNITVDDPSQGLAQELAATHGALNATQAALNATQGDLAATQSDLDAAASELAATEADLAATRVALASANASLAATRDELARANSSLAAADAAAAQRADAASRQISDLSGQASTNLLLTLAALGVGGAGLALALRPKRPPEKAP